MSDFSLELIAAVAANGVIGRAGQLPWQLPDDLRHFKSLTTGHAVIMGRRTYGSIGHPLPNRRNIVISRALTAPPAGIDLARSLDEAIALAVQSPGPAFVMGGAAVYAAAIPKAHVLHLTELDEPVEGDTFFPPFDRSQWQLTHEQRHDRDDRHAIPFHFRTYARLNSPTPPPAPSTSPAR